jgi:hypothetical protein
MSLTGPELDALLGGLVHALANAQTPLATNLSSLRRDVAGLVALVEAWTAAAQRPGGLTAADLAALQAQREALYLEPLGPTLDGLMSDMGEGLRRSQTLLRAARPLGRWWAPAGIVFDLAEWWSRLPTAGAPWPGVEVSFSPPAEASVVGETRVFGDPAHLTEAVSQLVRNAQRATAERAGAGVQVALTVEVDAWHVRVTDQGPGKTPALITALAVPFGAAAADRVGIGLTLVQWVARTHGGCLTLEDAATGGLEACLSLSRGGASWSEPRS